MSDPVSAMLTSIRNAVAASKPFVDLPKSNHVQTIAAAMVREGYLWEVIESPESEGAKLKLRLVLKYGETGEAAIRSLTRVSKPGCRVYVGRGDIPHVLQGMGECFLSTNKGVLSGREARSAKVGGELVCEVW